MSETMGALLEFFPHSTSSTILVGTVVLLLVFCLMSSRSSLQKHSKEPTGPRPLPFLGNLLHLDNKLPHRSLCKLAKKYGSIYTIYLGPKKSVVLAGYKTVRNALLNYGDAFAERHIHPIMHDIELTDGIVFGNGESWKEMRRFVLTNLKDFGMGRKTSEEKIIEECQHLIEEFTKEEGKPFDTKKTLNSATSNIICAIVFGSRFEYDDNEFIAMVRQANENMKILGSPIVQLYNMFPWFKWIPARNNLMNGIAVMKKVVSDRIGGLQKTLNPQMCKCIVDSFLVRKKQLEDSGNMKSHFHDDNILTSVLNLFSAGTDTTSTTVRYGLLIMAKYPKIQDQVQEELSSLIGSRQVRVEDRKNLHYTNAVIHEIQRLNIVVPLVEHCATKDVTLQGFLIRKGTHVISLLASVHNDESEWESPDTFNPSNFLDKNGTFVKRDAFMVFSAGQRSCIGEALARMEIFLFFTSLLQRFRFTPPPGVTEDELDLTPVSGLVLSPKLHKLCALPLHLS